MLIRRRQTTSDILMIRPAAFGFNPQTAKNNAFQQSEGAENIDEIWQKALTEFDAFVEKLRAADINVIVVEDTPEPVKTDAVFPNNWVSFHNNGTVVIYPMFAPTRRVERRQDIIDQLSEKYTIKHQIDFSEKEVNGQFLEGTGSLIFDRIHRIAYACLSPRTDEALLEEFCEWAGYEKVQFHAVDGEGQAIYHTNVMMSVGDEFVIICMDTIRDDAEKAQLEYYFRETEKEVITISLEQMNRFAGNMLQVENKAGETFLVMSEQAFSSLNDEQILRIKRHTHILHSPVYTLEKYGGGSTRCMMAEIFLNRV